MIKRKLYSYIFILLSVVGLLLIFNYRVVYGWFSSSKKLVISNTIGSIDHVTVDVSNPKEELKLPNDKTTKKYKITNTGTAPFILRAKINMYWSDSQGNKTPVKDDEVFSYYPSKEFNTHWYSNTSGGYYYLDTIIAPKESAPLFTAVLLLSPMLEPTDYSGHTLSIELESEALQMDLKAVTEVWKLSPESYEYNLIESFIREYKKKLS